MEIIDRNQTDISLRINTLMNQKKFNFRSFGMYLGYSDTAIRNIIKKKSKPNFELTKAIVEKFPDLSADWLLTGRGEMFKNETKEITSDKACVSSPEIDRNCKIKMLKERLDDKDNIIKCLESQLSSKDRIIEMQASRLKELERKQNPLS